MPLSGQSAPTQHFSFAENRTFYFCVSKWRHLFCKQQSTYMRWLFSFSQKRLCFSGSPSPAGGTRNTVRASGGQCPKPLRDVKDPSFNTSLKKRHFHNMPQHYNWLQVLFFSNLNTSRIWIFPENTPHWHILITSSFEAINKITTTEPCTCLGIFKYLFLYNWWSISMAPSCSTRMLGGLERRNLTNKSRNGKLYTKPGSYTLVSSACSLKVFELIP